MSDREAFEKWWPSVGQTIGKVAAWDAWQAALQSREPVVDAKPIAAVTGYYNGDCVVKALDPALVLPAGMALYAAPPAGKGGKPT